MAIPNSPNFKLSDVLTEVGLNPSNRLSSAFIVADAGANAYDPQYVGNKDRLSNFRNYDSARLYFIVRDITATRKDTNLYGSSQGSSQSIYYKITLLNVSGSKLRVSRSNGYVLKTMTGSGEVFNTTESLAGSPTAFSALRFEAVDHGTYYSLWIKVEVVQATDSLPLPVNISISNGAP